MRVVLVVLLVLVVSVVSVVGVSVVFTAVGDSRVHHSRRVRRNITWQLSRVL